MSFATIRPFLPLRPTMPMRGGVEIVRRRVATKKKNWNKYDSMLSDEEFTASPHCDFLSSERTRDFLERDGDGYAQSLTPADLHARGVPSVDAYVASVVDLAADFTDDEMERTRVAVRVVDDALFGIARIALTIDLRTAAVIPWRLAKTQRQGSRHYENSFPHTRKDVIFVTPMLLRASFLELVETLAHEKMHVFQRNFHEMCGVYFLSRGFQKHALRSSYPLMRSNPDLDAYVYTFDMQICGAMYRSSEPRGIDDVDDLGPTEHPNEHMAYDVGSMVVRRHENFLRSIK